MPFRSSAFLQRTESENRNRISAPCRQAAGGTLNPLVKFGKTWYFHFERQTGTGRGYTSALSSEKTNVMRVLDAKSIPYTAHSYKADPTLSGEDVAALLSEDPDSVFKTLVTRGKSGKHYVFVIPVKEELELRKAAKAVGEKSVEMIRQKELLPLTGYVHGGCSPVGMKKPFPTVLQETAILYDRICVSAGKLGCQIELRTEDLIAVTGCTLADVSG